MTNGIAFPLGDNMCVCAHMKVCARIYVCVYFSFLSPWLIICRDSCGEDDSILSCSKTWSLET